MLRLNEEFDDITLIRRIVLVVWHKACLVEATTIILIQQLES